MRYLVENDFNPRAGQRVVITGFRPSEDSDELWAATITLQDLRRTLRLRDEMGRPLWRQAGVGRKLGPARRGRAAGKFF